MSDNKTKGLSPPTTPLLTPPATLLSVTTACIQSLCKAPTFLLPSTFLGSSYFLQTTKANPFSRNRDSKCYIDRRIGKKTRGGIVCGVLFSIDPWAPSIDPQSIAVSVPWFLYFITKSKSAPKLTLFGFYFLLTFVGATTKVNYGTSLANVDWLHGGAKALLTLTNIFIVVGLRGALRKAEDAKERTSTPISGLKEEKKTSI